MTSDSIADMLIRIKNALAVKKEEVRIPASKLKLEIASILKKEGFIEDFEHKEGKGFGDIFIKLKYKGKEPVITELRRISKPSKRVYVKSKKIPLVLRGLGIVILSTPAGVMTGQEAKKQGLGGEVICEVW